MRKLADIENSDLYMDYKYAYEHIITFDDCTENSSYSVFDMFYNAIKDGFDMEFHPYCDSDGAAHIIKISKNGLYVTEYIISDISDEKAVILEISEFIKYATGEINKKIDKERSNE